ncbi:MAG: hypothetical protein K9N11_05430 [Lentisphaeria bacterium]|nr:hypothetical protein [Candidatus Neomarinimicrobiota bacterium]MCF7842273.1 hypothetical protein [Lentisphaeria bacterium]
MEPLAPKYRVYIRLMGNQESFADVDSIHGKIGCTGCHGGISPVDEGSDAAAMNAAHQGMVRDPSEDAETSCGGGLCHGDIARRNATSIHTNLWGEKAHVAQRYGGEGFTFDQCPESTKSGYQANCYGCHTSCGQCHISRPTTAGGGFAGSTLGGNHKFIREPSETYNCTACHGGRIGMDWAGTIEGNQPDVHKIFGMTCTDCHTEDFHGDGPGDAQYTSRYEVDGLPDCYTSCHGADSDDNLYHQAHWAGQGTSGDITCYACHSQQYDNCNTCHAGSYTEEYNQPGGYKVYQDFKIGLNPNYGISGKTHNHEKWIVVRHIPVSRDAYKNWGLETLAYYESIPTYKYTSPHNIQRWTSRTLADSTWLLPDSTSYTAQTCADNCHYHRVNVPGNPQATFYLLSAQMDNLEQSDEKGANANVTLDDNGSVQCAHCHNH